MTRAIRPPRGAVGAAVRLGAGGGGRGSALFYCGAFHDRKIETMPRICRRAFRLATRAPCPYLREFRVSRYFWAMECICPLRLQQLKMSYSVVAFKPMFMPRYFVNNVEFLRYTMPVEFFRETFKERPLHSYSSYFWPLL
jgi:hypothetical protein